MPGKFAVGSIEEDFKKIGLIPAVVAEAVSTAVEVEGVAKPVVEAAPKTETPAEKPAAVATEPAAEEPKPAEVTEGIKLLRKKRPTGKLRMQRRKQKMLRRRNKGKLKLKARKFRRSARGKRFLRKYKMAMKRFHGHAPKGRRLSLRMGLDNVANMLEEVQEIVSAIDTDAKQETVKSFANLALISNKLAESFAFACANLEVEDEDNEEIDLCGGAEHFESLANSAANLAEALQAALQEGTEFEGTPEEVADTFAVMLKDVLEGLDVFSDLSEEEEDEDSNSDDESEEESDEDSKEEALRTRTTRDLTPDDEAEAKECEGCEGCEDCDSDSDSDSDSADDVEKDNDDDDASNDNTSNVDTDDKGAKKKARPTK